MPPNQENKNVAPVAAPTEGVPAAAPEEVVAPAPVAPLAKAAPAPAAAPVAAPFVAASPKKGKPLPRRSRFSSGALPLLLLAALFVAIGSVASWYESQLETEAKVLAEEIGASIVPDEALVPSAVKGARAANADLAAALAPRFAPRAEPVAALRSIEAAAKDGGITSSFLSVEVLGWDGNPNHFGDFDLDTATSAPYAAVSVTVEARGSWVETLTLASNLEKIPLVSRVDSLRLSAAADEGDGSWVLTTGLAVAAK
jgi:hypothetical protein